MSTEPTRKFLRLVGKHETYCVNPDGHIGRPMIGMRPSGKWVFLGLVRRNNFGHVVEYIPFKEIEVRLSDIEWRYRNGKPRYTVRDLDHGTVREWGEGVMRINLVEG